MKQWVAGLDLEHSKVKNPYFYFCKVIKKLIERIFAKNFARNYEKKQYLEHWTLGR